MINSVQAVCNWEDVDVCALLVSLGPDWLDASPVLQQGLSFSIK